MGCLYDARLAPLLVRQHFVHFLTEPKKQRVMVGGMPLLGLPDKFHGIQRVDDLLVNSFLHEEVAEMCR